ncbi:MAG: twin-arginine translocation signal domain-containing protein [Actinomycetota bacterium]
MSERETGHDSSRRDFLKKSLVGGAVLWSAPVVTSLPGGKAWAQTYGVCNCDASAFGLFVSIPALGIAQTFGEDGCVANVPLGNNTVAFVRATTVCGADFSSVNAGCSSEATIATLVVRAGPAVAPTLLVNAQVLFTTASATCSPCGTTGAFSAASVTVSGSLVGGPINVDVGAACNTSVAGLVTVNEQFCVGGTLNVNAVHVNLPGIIEVIAAHSEAGATGCPCTTC